MDPEETQGTPSDPEEEILEAPSDPEEVTLEVPSDPDEETQETPLDPEDTHKASPNAEEETQEAPSGPVVETNGVAGLAAESTDLEGPDVPAHRKLTISGNISPNNVIAHVEPTGARRHERSSATKFSADKRGRRRGDCVNVRRRGLDDFAEEGGDSGADSEGCVIGAVNREQAMNPLEMEVWRKVRKKKKYKVA